MKFSWFLALRYLKPKRTFISVITVISVVGVALGVGVLLVVIAVMSGFEKQIKEEFLKVEPSIIVRDEGRSLFETEPEDAPALPEWRDILTKLKQHPEVLSASPQLIVTAVTDKKPTAEEEEILKERDGTAAEAQAVLVGVDPADTAQVERLQKSMDSDGAGSFDVAGDGIVLTNNLANRLGREFPLILEESQVNAYGPAFLREYRKVYKEEQLAKDDAEAKQAVAEKDRDLPLPEEFTVKGFIDGSKMGDQPIGFISLKNAQRLAGSGKNVGGISLELTDPFRAGEVADEMKKSLPAGWYPETWMDRHKPYFDAIANERGMMYIVLGFISLVAAFSIGNTMITMAVQKRREIGMMRALGATSGQVIQLFVAKGIIVATLGVGLGYMLGMAVLTYRNALKNWIAQVFDWQIFDERIYGIREIPADPRWQDNLLICGIAFVLCALAAVPPALLVSRMDPAKALRSDR